MARASTSRVAFASNQRRPTYPVERGLLGIALPTTAGVRSFVTILVGELPYPARNAVCMPRVRWSEISYPPASALPTFSLEKTFEEILLSTMRPYSFAEYKLA